MKPIAFYVLDWVTKLIKKEPGEVSIMIKESKKQDLFMMTVAGNAVGTGSAGKIDIPLLRYETSVSGGTCHSEIAGNKQVITATFRLSYPERSPLGDIAGMLTIMIAACKNTDFDYVHATDNGTFCFSTSEAKKSYKVESLEGFETLNMIGSSISEGLKRIGIADINV